MHTRSATTLLSLFALLGVLFTAGPLAAQNQPIAPGARPLTAEQLAELDVRASQLIGREVHSTRGETLGEIEDLIVDLENSRVHYAVLEFGETLGLGGKLFAYPVNKLQIAAEQQALVLNTSKEQLKKAPGFEEGDWPDWNAGTYRSRVDSYFFKQDELQRLPQGSRLTRASDVIGKDVEDRGSQSAGKLAELVVNLGNGQIRYAVLDFDQSWNLKDKLVALPLEAFQFPTRPDIPIYLTMDRTRIAKARPFDKNNWPDLNSARHRQQIEEQLSALAADKNARATGQSAPAGSSAAGQ